MGYFENGTTGGSKWPTPLKIVNNEVKKLKVVQKLSNLRNFEKFYKKYFVTNIFYDISIFGQEMPKS